MLAPKGTQVYSMTTIPQKQVTDPWLRRARAKKQVVGLHGTSHTGQLPCILRHILLHMQGDCLVLTCHRHKPATSQHNPQASEDRGQTSQVNGDWNSVGHAVESVYVQHGCDRPRCRSAQAASLGCG